ncbi:MAG: class II glutamine amidotransferase [Candidatus Omnitrophica bacterium]|nr:class II glutamine amidotransferase [Candidatus Omnitrophota bacterium]
MSKPKLNSTLFIIALFTSVILFTLFPGELSAECRFWAAISDKIPQDVTLDHLLNLPNSLRALGKVNNDGWGIGYYNNNDALLLKGAISADTDQDYSESVARVAHLEPKVIVAHVRKASSGCRGNVENPHPFKRNKNGKDWLFGHNGTIDKDILIGLIGTDYLNENSPNTCTYDPPNSWVDSELYFILLLKYIQENDWDVETGIREAILKLDSVISRKIGLNFFLTDGDTIWAFRRGYSLYYYYQPDLKYSVVASMFPYEEKEDWIEVPEKSLVVMKPDASVELISISAPVASAKKLGGPATICGGQLGIE